MPMWSLCSNVCVCAKTDQAAKVDSQPIKADIALKGFLKGDGVPTIGYEDPAGLKVDNRSRLTVTATVDGMLAGDIALAVEDPSALGAPMASLDIDGPPLPLPRDLVDSVRVGPAEIFGLMKKGYICAFGSSQPPARKVLGGKTAFIEQDFAEKQLEIYGAGSAEQLRSSLQSIGIAINCRKGKKPEQPNQDNVLFCKMESLTICGVADGHGPDGHWASHWAARYVLKLLLDQVIALGKAPGDDTLSRIFDITHQAVKMRSEDDRFDLSMSGSTLSVCIIDHDQKTVVSAWAGDSRCGLGRPGGARGEPLTQDHKPQDVAEKDRIHASGGEVVRLEGDMPHRVFVKGGEVPGLAMSRAVGDLIAHRVGVIHEPGIVRRNLEDHFVLCCSDGVWEFMECDEAGQLASKVGRTRVREAGEQLCKESRKRWLKEEQTITDDISAIVIWL